MGFEGNDIFGSEDFAQFLEGGVKPFDMTNLENALSFSRCIHERFGFVNTSRDRLFDQDMYPSRKTGESNRVMQQGWHGNAHSIDEGQQIAIVVKKANAIAIGNALPPIHAGIGDTDELDIF